MTFKSSTHKQQRNHCVYVYLLFLHLVIFCISCMDAFQIQRTELPNGITTHLIHFVFRKTTRTTTTKNNKVCQQHLILGSIFDSLLPLMWTVQFNLVAIQTVLGIMLQVIAVLTWLAANLWSEQDFKHHLSFSSLGCLFQTC